ncbi:MAG: type II secretion system protein N [Gammaproteobacteria bacterium]
MKKVIRYALAGFALYVFFLVILLPADRIYSLLKSRMSLPVQLYEVDGSVWQGYAGVAMAGKHRLESVNWELKVLPLIWGQLQTRLSFNKGEGNIAGTVGKSIGGKVFVRDTSAVMPMADIEPMLMNSPIGLSGNVNLQLENLTVESPLVSDLKGQVTWNQAGLASMPDTAIGDFSMIFEPTPEGIKGVLKDKGGPLQAEGLLNLKSDGNYKFTGKFSSADPARGDIKQALRFFGTPSPDGKVSITYSGKLDLGKYL